MSDELKEQVIGATDAAPANAEPAKAKVGTGTKDSVKRLIAKGAAAPAGAKDTAPTGAKDGTLGAKD